MTLEILFASEQRAFAPGETIRGRIRWHLNTIPEWIEVRLFWFTEGKGTKDLGVIHTQRFTDSTMSGEQSFSLIAPAYPPSCSGRLVSICWGLELVSNVPEQVPFFPLIIAPNAQAIALSSVDERLT